MKFDAKASGLKSKIIGRNARYTQFALVAAAEALADAKLDLATIDKDRFGCIVGSGIGGVEWFEDNCNAFAVAGGGYSSLRSVQQFLIPALISNTASGMIAIQHGAKGPNYCVTTACASGTVYFEFITSTSLTNDYNFRYSFNRFRFKTLT